MIYSSWNWIKKKIKKIIENTKINKNKNTKKKHLFHWDHGNMLLVSFPCIRKMDLFRESATLSFSEEEGEKEKRNLCETIM